MTTDNFIHVSAEAWGDEKPRAALIHVTLTADKLFSGRAAFDKAVELRRLVSALGARDIPDSAVALQGATLDVSTGLFTRSSSVTYRVRIRIDDIERLADALDAIAESKQARLSHLEWDYAASSNDELMADCATRAMAKAKRLATSLGVTLAGVHSVHEEQMADPPPYPAYPQMMMAGYDAPAGMMPRRSRFGAELEGLDLAPTKKVGVRVRVAYAITH
jgi:uncharacterized protein YggE